MASPTLRAALAELLGTFVMVTVGTGTVATSVLFNTPRTLPAVAAFWGVGVALAITLTARTSGAHLNPAVTTALAVFRPEQFRRCHALPYIVAQVAGASLAGAVVLATFHSAIVDYEHLHAIAREGPTGELTSRIFGESFPNPGDAGVGDAAWATLSPVGAFAWEAAGTAALLFVVAFVSDPRSRVRLPLAATALLVGATVAAIICVVAPHTQAGLNPARDFGPRFIAWLAGWEQNALPGARGGWWVYVVGPIAGGLLGFALYEFAFARLLRRAVHPEVTE